MAVTTEPPWLHKSSGVAARNGTTSHTITFSTDGDAPFTPATGSLLVVYVFGAVTHSTTGSWTEQAQPVSSGELSVFTSTNNSSTAPPSSIVVTHNGSNYPMPFCVLEFPAGSVHVGSQGDNASNDTFAALSGLSGAAMVIIGAKGRVATGTETTASSVWGAPWVEDADLFTPNSSGTDGGYLTVGHQINVTTTSVTPTTTTTYTGTWPVADREKISTAINAAAASSTTPVSGSLDLRWQVANVVSSSLDLRWQVRNVVSNALDLRWAVLNSLASSLDLRWSVLNSVSSSLDLRWQVRNLVSGAADLRWAVLNTVSSSIDLRWVVSSGSATQVSGTLDLRWVSAGQVSGGLDLRWQVLNRISSSMDLRWQVLNLVASSLDLRWIVRNLVSNGLDLRWAVANRVNGNVDLRWVVAASVNPGDITVSIWNGTSEVELVADGVWSSGAILPILDTEITS